MRKFGRKLTSALLALAMFVSLIPVGAAPAQAEETTNADTGVFTVTGGKLGTDYAYSGPDPSEPGGAGVLTVKTSTELTISTNNATESPANGRIVIENGVTANITLAGLSIKPADSSTSDGCSGIDLGSGATLDITLQSGSSNVINGGISGTAGTPAPGIHVPEGSTLTITGNGSLEVNGAYDAYNAPAVGIGGMGASDEAGGACGNVLILGGTITVHGGTSSTRSSVDIGGGASDSGKGGDCNTVIILTSVNSGEALTIGGGKGVSSNNGSDGAGIRPVSGQENTYTVWGNVTLPCDITIPAGATVVIPEGTSLTVPQGTTLTNNGTISVQGGAFSGEVSGTQPIAAAGYTINYANETITASNGYELSATNTETAEESQTLNLTPGEDVYIRLAELEGASWVTVDIPARPAAPAVTATIDYSGEKLSFPSDVTETTLEYALSQSDPNWKDVPSGAALSEMGWTGTAIYLYFRTGATDSAFASSATTTPITVPARPTAPNDLNLMDYTDVSVTYYVGEGVQCRLNNERDWVTPEPDETDYTFTGLTPQTTYTIYARNPATESQFASAEASDEVTTKSSAPVAPEMTYEVTANSITLSYSAPWQYQTSEDEWISVEGAKEFTSLEAAMEYTFTVRIAESETAEASQVGTVKVYTAHAAPAANEGYAINYATETLTVKDDYEVNTAENFTGTAIQSGASLSGYIGKPLYIRHAGTQNGAPASAAVALEIPARPAAPANISGGTEQISGVDSSMEYRAVGSTGWTRCTGTSISNLSDGDYEVRIAATDSAFASEAVQVHVSPYTGKYSYEISTDVGDNGTISVNRYATEGERVTIAVSPDEAYKLGALSVTAHGKDVELTDNGNGTFSFTMPSGDVRITATFAEDPDWTPDEPEEPATDVSEIFLDVAPNAWYKDAVQYAYDNGLMTGVSDTEFAPEATTTRAMIVSILARLENVTSAESAGFADVGAGDWYATAVNWAASVGVVSGTGDGNFSPNAAITREQLAAMLMNYSAWKGEDVSARADLSGYSDQPSAWATETMSWAVAEGLISGVTADQLQPQGNATRAQVAAILQRFLCK